VLIDAALQLVGESGPDAVSVRAAARRAGVSPGAPFRHFASRDALMQAVAEEAQRRFRTEIEAALSEAPAGDPLARFRSLGQCATPPISRSFPVAAFSITIRRKAYRPIMPN